MLTIYSLSTIKKERTRRNDMAQDNKQMALLKNKMQMPLIVRDMLITNQIPNAEENYALHELLGNFSADEALLCSAFVMKEIANFETISSNDLTFLHMECDRLIERYSAKTSLAEENPEIWSEAQINMVDIIYEDIADFIELIELCQLSFEITNPNIVKFLNIITPQLQSHMIIIDEVISMQQKSIGAGASLTPPITGFEADNVVMFPS